MKSVATILCLILAGCAPAFAANHAVQVNSTNSVLTSPPGFIDSNGIARVSAVNSSNSVQDAAIASKAGTNVTDAIGVTNSAQDLLIGAKASTNVTDALAATNDAQNASISAKVPTNDAVYMAALTNGVGDGATVTVTGRTVYVTVTPGTGTAASVQADLDDHKTNATAHAELIAAKLDASRSNDFALASHSQPLSTITNAGTAAYSNSGDFATAAQGALADTALQAESDTLDSVVARGNSTTTISLNTIIDSDSKLSVDFDSRTLYDDTGPTAMAIWGVGAVESGLCDPVSGAATVDVKNRKLYGIEAVSGHEKTAIDWGLRTLNGTNGTTVALDWSSGRIVGDGSGLTNITAAQVGAASTTDLQTAEGAFNGLSVKDPVMTLAVDGDGPYATVTASEGGDMQYWFGGNLVSYGSTNIIRLTAGTTNAPALNYICALETGGLTNYTAYPYFPSAGASRAIMFEVFLMDTNSIIAGTGYALRSWTDNFANRRGLGRTAWIGERVRRLPAIWESGVQASLDATAATTAAVADAYITTSEGVGWQMHSHTIPANTNRQNMWVINSSQGFRGITNLNQITMAPDGSTILGAASDTFALNIFAFVESGITPKSTRLMITLSTDDYTAGSAATKLANCIADSSSYDVTGVPVWMQGMTIRIARIVVQRNSTGTDRIYRIYDRRGQPLGTSGGGASSSGESDPVFGAWLPNALTNIIVGGATGTVSGGMASIFPNVLSSNLLALVVNGTCSIPYNASAPAWDQQFQLTATGAVTFMATIANWPTNRAQVFVLDLYSGANQITWDAATMKTNLMTLSTNTLNHMIWSRGVGHTNWVGTGYAW